MNFQTIPPVESSKKFLDFAFRRAREQGKSKKLRGNWLQIIRQKEALKLDVIKDNVTPRLIRILQAFPNTLDMSNFYNRLMELTLDYVQYKKSLGAINWAMKKVNLLHREFVRRIIKEKDRQEISALSKQFYGRISSVLKQIDSNLQYLEVARKIMRTYPDVKDLFTVCLYGFPNVGKSTLLNKLTTSRAKVAAYAFTTKSINSGFMTVDDQKIQLLDVPGTLARKDKMNNVEMQAELVVEELADVLIYVFDLSGHCGYSVKEQEKLFEKVRKRKTVLVYLSKTDIIEPSVVAGFKRRHYSLTQLRKEIHSLSQKN